VLVEEESLRKIFRLNHANFFLVFSLVI
jgi:hypothetical protein